METAIIVRGRIADPHHIELEEPLRGLTGPVEVTVRAVEAVGCDVFDLIASLAPRARSKAEIDQQIAEERASWVDR